MSESAVILEGEVARRFNPVDKLRVTNQDSSVSDWVPSDTLDLGSLMASENTLYLANIDDDCDAYEEVEVDVSEELEDGDYKKITGKGNDGNDYAVGLDENGNLTSEMVPSAIHIVIKPRKLEYEEGETLDFTGIHVYLMDGNNQRFTSEDYPTGEIPFEELLLPVTVADKDGSSEEIIYPDYLDHGTVKVESVGSISSLIDEMLGYFPNGYRDPHGFIDQIKMFVSSFEGIHPVVVNVDIANIRFHGWSPFSVIVFTSIKVGDDVILGKNHECIAYSTFGDQYPDEPMEILEETARDSASRLILGSHDQSTYLVKSSLNAQIIGGANVIPVQWMRSDGEMLEDNFTISISAIDDTGSWGDSTDPINVNESGHTSGGF